MFDVQTFSPDSRPISADGSLPCNNKTVLYPFYFNDSFTVVIVISNRYNVTIVQNA